MEKIKDFENHQEKRIREMRERFLVYKKKKGKKEEVFKVRLRKKK
jgi:hypothetical protein